MENNKDYSLEARLQMVLQNVKRNGTDENHVY